MTITAERAEAAWFDKLTMSAHPEPFDSPLILSLSKDEQLAQDRPVEGWASSAFDVVDICRH